MLHASLALTAVLVAAGVSLKLYAAPLHVWIGELYAGSAVMTAAFLALIPPLSLLAAWHSLGCYATAGIALTFAGAASMFIGPGFV